MQSVPPIAARFLTHMHADHTEGLGDGWDGEMIHCSSLTAQLLQVWLRHTA